MAKRFLKRWAILVMLISISVMSFTALVDPYGLIGTPRWTGLNAKKPTAANRSSVIKPYQVARARADVLILGNSRPEMGLAPDHRCLAPIGRGFSLTLPGADVYQFVRSAQHALASHRPKLLLVGVDFVDFLVQEGRRGDPGKWPPYTAAFEERLAVDAYGRHKPSWVAKVTDYRNALFSLTGFVDAVYTLLAQRDPHAMQRRADGFNPAKDYLAIIRAEGQKVLFAQKLDELHARLRTPEWSLDHSGYSGSTEFTALERLLDTVADSDIETIVFINPYHARYLDALQSHGLTELFADWKARVASMVAAREGVAMWDFASLNTFTTEAAPAKNDRETVLQWFWEPAHYRRSLGDLMLAQMLADKGCEWPNPALPKPGVLLVSP